MPHSQHDAAREPWRMAANAPFDVVPPGAGACRLQSAATATTGLHIGGEADFKRMQPAWHRVLVPWLFEGPHITAGPDGGPSQPALWYIRAGDSHRYRSIRRGADQ